MIRKRDTLNGFPVVRAEVVDRRRDGKPARIILVDRGEDSYPRFVTALHFVGDKEWMWGHYIDTLIDARSDFAERVVRGY